MLEVRGAVGGGAGNESLQSPLIKVLLDRAESAADAQTAADLMLDASRLYRDQFSDPASARSILVRALETHPTSTKVADALEALAHETGRWAETIHAYRHVARALASAEPRIASELWLRVACAHLADKNDMNAAQRALAEVDEIDPDRAGHYVDVLEKAAKTVQALQAVASLCQRIGDRKRLTSVLSRGIVISCDPQAKARFHLLVGEAEVAGGDRRAGEWHLGEAARLDPKSTDVRCALASLYRDGGEHLRAAQWLESAGAAIVDPKARADLALEAAANLQ